MLCDMMKYLLGTGKMLASQFAKRGSQCTGVQRSVRFCGTWPGSYRTSLFCLNLSNVKEAESIKENMA